MPISVNVSAILSGQGLDVANVVQQIISAQSGQLSVWQNQQSTFATQNGLLAGINNNLTNLQTAVAALASPTGALTAQAATSSQPGILTGAAQSTAISGTHSIVVTGLATTGTLYTEPIAAGAATSFLPTGQTTGDFQIQVGGATGTTRDIAVTQGSNDTLNSLASYINTQSTTNQWGVTASVVSDASGSRLALQSQASGTTGALALVSNSNTTSLTFDTPTGGANAALFIDGVPFSSTTNIVTGAIPGVTLSLVSQSNTAVQLTVGADTAQITAAVNNFVSAYNTVVSTINAEYVVDPTGAIPAPPLESDISLRALQSNLLADASYAVGGNGGMVNLASLGINSNNDGTLTIGSNAAGETFAQVVAANPGAVQSFFQNSTGTGFANNFNTDLTGLTDITLGPLNVDLKQNQTEQADLAKTITNFQIQLSSRQVQLTAQYNAINASLQAYPLLLQEVTQTLGSMSPIGSAGTAHPTLTSGL
jgi:flagellar hook-associated protein 2